MTPKICPAGADAGTPPTMQPVHTSRDRCFSSEGSKTSGGVIQWESSQPAGLKIFANGVPFGTRSGPRSQPGGKFSKPHADEMVLQRLFFKPKTGGGEV